MSNTSNRGFAFGCVFELLLGAAALIAGWLLGVDALGQLRWSTRTFVAGCVATLPMLGLLWFTARSRWAPLRELRRVVDSLVRPFFQGWSVAQIAVLSLLAGLCEELFFRGLIQGGLTGRLGETGALIAASIVFGLLHFVTRLYAILAAIIGVYLGTLWLWTDNLLAPVAAHALYDFIALMYFVRRSRQDGE